MSEMVRFAVSCFWICRLPIPEPRSPAPGRSEGNKGVLHELECENEQTTATQQRSSNRRGRADAAGIIVASCNPSHQNIGTNFLLVAAKDKDEINKGFIALYPSANTAHICNSLLVLCSDDFDQENLVGAVCASRPSSYAHEYSHGSI